MNRRLTIHAIVCVLLLPFAAAAAPIEAPVAVPVYGTSFEDGSGVLPDGWEAAYGNGANIEWCATGGCTGSRCVCLHDASASEALGLRCAKIRVETDDHIGISGYYRSSVANALVYFEFWDALGARMSGDVVSFSVSSTGNWNAFAHETTVPKGATHATILLYSTTSGMTDGYFDDVGFQWWPLEPDPSEQTILSDSFEQGGAMPDGWTVEGMAGGITWSTDYARIGTRSVRIVDATTTQSVGYVSNLATVRPGEVVEGRAWFLAETSGGATVDIDFYDAAGARMTSAVKTFGVSSNGDWQDASTTTTVPDGACSATLRLYCDATSVVDGYFDDVALLYRGYDHATPVNIMMSESFETADAWDIDFGPAANFTWLTTPSVAGSYSVRMIDQSATQSAGIRSPRIGVTPGDDVWIKIWFRGTGGPSVYFEYWNATNTRFETQSYGIPNVSEEWQQSRLEHTVPEGAVNATVLLYSSTAALTEGYFDLCEFGTGFEPTHDRTPQPASTVAHPAGPIDNADIANAKENVTRHTWAQNVKNSTKYWADFWKDRSDDLEYWIPRLTPFRVVNCPVCDANWSYAWTTVGRVHMQCRNCGTIFPNREFPETEIEILTAPTGAQIPHPCYVDRATSKTYRLSGHSRYRRTAYLNYLDDMARYYVLSDDASYAEAGAKILRRLAEVYPDWVVHDWDEVYTGFSNLQSGKVCGWKLYDARMILGAAQLYDFIHDSGYLSEADKVKIETSLFREFAEMCMPVVQHGCCYNDGTYQMSAVAFVGALLGDHRYVDYAVSPPGGFLGFMHDFYFRDGHWQDGSPSYEGMVTEELYLLPEILKGYSDPASYTEPDRFDNLNVTADEMVKKVHLTPLYCMLPDRTLPPINDGAKGRTYNSRHAEVQYNWYPSEKSLEILNWVYDGNIGGGGTRYSLFRRNPDQDFSGLSQADLSSATLVRPGLGWAILREGSGDSRTDLVFDYGEPAAWHGHPDRLNFILYANGHEIVTDLGYLGARHHFRPWMAHGVCHNLVMVDGVDQAREPGELILCASGPKVQAVVAEAPNTYSQCSRYERNLVLVTPVAGVQYVVDVFHVAGGDLHDYSFHGEGTPETFSCAALASAVAYPGDIGPEEGGYDWLEDGKFTSATGEIVADWRLGDLYPGDATDGVRLRMLDTSGNLINGKGPNLRSTSDPFAEPMLDYVIQRRPGPDNTFVAVIEPVDNNSPVVTAASVVPVSETHSGTFGSRAVKVTHSAGTDYIVVTPDPARNVSVSDNGHTIALTGRLGVVSFDSGGDLRFLWAADGEQIACGEHVLAIQPTATGTIVAASDDADTFAIEGTFAPGFGSGLGGKWLYAGSTCDGAYEIDRVSDNGTTTTVYLRDEPIVMVEPPQSFRIPAWGLYAPTPEPPPPGAVERVPAWMVVGY